MSYELEDIDTFLQNIKDKQEVDDFIKKGIYPDRLKSKPVVKHIHTELNTLSTLHIVPSIEIDNTFNINLMNKMNDLENKIKETLERENEVNNDNECPICMENIGNNNYIVPICGHRVCMNCFTNNIRHNNNMSHHCCLCITRIIPNT